MQDNFKSFLNKIFPLVLLIGYIFLPFFLAQFVCLCLFVHLFFKRAIRQNHLLLSAAAVYSLAFIITPFSCYLFTSPEKFSKFIMAATNLVLVAMGFVWLYAVGRNNCQSCLESQHGKYFFTLYSLLFLVLFLPSWKANLPYGGDELYHIMSAQVFRIFLANAATVPALVVYILAIVITFVFIDKNQKNILTLGVAGLLLAALWSQFTYGQNTELLASLWRRERLVRYPMAQTWISCLLANASWRYWVGSCFSNEVLRFLPLLSLFSLGLVLGGEKKWRQAPAIFVSLATIFIATIPDFFYHATILYLELPCLFLMTIVLLDKEILTAHGKLWKKSSYWALILLGFTKETAIPVILVILSWRAIFQLQLWRKGEQCFTRLVKQEFEVWFCALFPAFLYFAIRYKVLCNYPGMYHRAYGGQFSNILDISMWIKGFSPLWYQFGIVLILACYGAWTLIKNGAWKTVLLCVSLLVALKAFFICDSSLWLGLPRFNLPLLPAIIVLAWEGLSDVLEKSQRITGVILILLVAVNLAMSPVNLRGKRTWKDSGELWYPYNQCLVDVRQAAPMAHILLGNMQYRYGVQIVTTQLKWYPYIRQYPLKSCKIKVEETLKFARKQHFEIVIYRNEGDVLVKNDTCYGFIKIGEYRAQFGSLIVFCDLPLAYRISCSKCKIGDGVKAK